MVSYHSAKNIARPAFAMLLTAAETVNENRFQAIAPAYRHFGVLKEIILCERPAGRSRNCNLATHTVGRGPSRLTDAEVAALSALVDRRVAAYTAELARRAGP